jgi:amidophosphoribosyltransferase
MKELGDVYREECGLMGLVSCDEAANLAYLGLYAQQHRGQEGAGIATCDTAVSEVSHGETEFHLHRGQGLVADVFARTDFSTLAGKHAIGHVRYTTAGGSSLVNVQPFVAEVSFGKVAIAHNGNLTNAAVLREQLIAQGAIFATASDSEVLLHLLARTDASKPLPERIVQALTPLDGGFCFLILCEDRLFAARDAHGLRPLVLGSIGDGFVLASESCAFDLLDAHYIREIEPGEVLEISFSDGQHRRYFPFQPKRLAPCIFEFVYFARPDSVVFGDNVYSVRKRLGEELAAEALVEADMVIPVPDSGVTAAIGFSQASGIPLEMGLIRNHYVGRTFIEPQQSIRHFGVKIKLNANAELLRGKRIIVVDDSLVRGTTSKKIVEILRRAGAKEVHLRISAPPTTDPCYYGIDTPSKDELIASSRSVAEIQKFIDVDTLAFLSREGMFRAVRKDIGTMCDACFSGDYPDSLISIGAKN